MVANGIESIEMYNKKIKIAFLGSPILGGNYTHYNYLKEGLKDFDFTLLNAGRSNVSMLQDDNFVHLGKDLDRNKNAKVLAKLVIDYLESEHFDIVIPMNSGLIISIIPFLNSKIKIVQIVNSDTPRVYKSVTSHIDYVDKIICISLKQIQELKKRVPSNFFNEKTLLIPHGVKTQNTPITSNLNEPLRIGFLGRMHQGHKNIFILPEVLKNLNHHYKFELIGEGTDKNELLNKLNALGIEYKDWGVLPHEMLNKHISNWDILLFPSTIEGFGLTIVEGMNMGVVPIANRLSGITDFIITDKKDGFVVTKNKVEIYVSIINELHRNRMLLNKMKKEAVTTVQQRFNLDEILLQYAKVFKKVNENIKTTKTIEFKNWKPFIEYKPNLIKRILNKLFL